MAAPGAASARSSARRMIVFVWVLGSRRDGATDGRLLAKSLQRELTALRTVFGADKGSVHGVVEACP